MVRFKLFAWKGCQRLSWPNSAENTGLLMAGVLEMPSDKGMTCSGQMEAMINDGCEEGHFHRTIEKLRLKYSPNPPKAAGNLHGTHSILDF